ncbi:hypothetical protein ACE14D_04430 [Streptomyces sp. Act-28]
MRVVLVDLVRYCAVYAFFWCGYLASVFVIEAAPWAELLKFMSGLLLLTGTPSAILIVIARLMAMWRHTLRFVVTAPLLLALPLPVMLMGSPPGFLIQLLVQVSFLVWTVRSEKQDSSRP